MEVLTLKTALRAHMMQRRYQIGGAMMNAITIRNLSDEVSRALELRAAENGTTAEVEAERILQETLTVQEKVPPTALDDKPPLKLGTALWQLGQEFGGLDLDVARDPAPIKPASFE